MKKEKILFKVYLEEKVVYPDRPVQITKLNNTAKGDIVVHTMATSEAKAINNVRYKKLLKESYCDYTFGGGRETYMVAEPVVKTVKFGSQITIEEAIAEAEKTINNKK